MKLITIDSGINLKRFFFFLFALFFSLNSFSQYNLIVSQDGTADYTTIQAAINAAPVSQSVPYIIYIKNGRYKEKINIPSNKPFLQLVGEDVSKVILTYDDYSAKMVTCNTTVGTQNSASFTVNANDFSAINITFENSFGDGSQAVAVLSNADRVVFYNCRFLGNQDTLYLKGAINYRNYFKKCYIDGNIDFIFGSTIALFDSCVVYAKTRSATTSSYITAPNTPSGQLYGFVFRDSEFPNNIGNTLYYLSRPWASPSVSGTRQNVVLLNCSLSSHIKPAGWSIWDANTVTSNLFYGEYNSHYFNGSPVDVSQRVSWSHQLSQTDSANYSISNLFGTWNPCTVVTSICNSSQASLASSNFKVARTVVSSAFSWNNSWPLNGIQYSLLKSTDNVLFTSVYDVLGTSDSAINFNYTDLSVPASGSKFYYYLSASKTGYPSSFTDTIVISNASNIVVNASAALSLCGFSQLLGTASAAQTYSISGSNLTADINITAPTNFEISLDNINWFTSSSTLHVTPVSGTVSSTLIYIRLNAAVIGTSSGNILNISTGTSQIPVAVSGITFAASTSFLLQEWPLTINNNDSAAIRSSSVLASAALVNNSANRLYTSDGTQPTAGPIPAYSGQYGQALGSNTSGNTWSSIGSTLNRNYYEQFTVTASGGNNIRVDSITFLSDFYLTTSGIKMAVVYSKNGFSTPADSIEINNGVGPNNTSLALSASGTFLKSFPLLRNDAGPVNYYALSLNGVNGINLASGETLTIRLYWACGSTGVPRFAFLKNVIIKGVVLNPVPFKLISFNAAMTSNNLIKLSWKTSTENNVNHYDIEHSSDGLNFNKIGEQSSLKNINFSDYAFEDYQPLYSVNYYRLKIVDEDGNYKYSAVKCVQKFKKNNLEIYPNPVIKNVSIVHEKAVKGAYISLINTNGEVIMTVKIKEGISKTTIDVSTLPVSSFVYAVLFNNNGTIQAGQFIKH